MTDKWVGCSRCGHREYEYAGPPLDLRICRGCTYPWEPKEWDVPPVLVDTIESLRAEVREIRRLMAVRGVI